MAEHPESRTFLAPPFFHAMMDIAFNFPGKRLLTKFNFCWVRMVGAIKIHLFPNLKSSELINNIPETMKNILFFVQS